MLIGKGVLAGHEQDFLDAAQQYNINPVYLIAHARLESGNGASTLASGVYVAAGTYKNSQGKTVVITNSGTYYNFFGIHAYDAAPVTDGSQYAANQNWNSVRAAIFGGAKWIATNYVDCVANGNNYDQDTLYDMRFDPYGFDVNGSGFRYATSTTWANSVASIISQYAYIFDGKTLTYNIPVYSNS
jgi:beta-N-acetylglucosaminidase